MKSVQVKGILLSMSLHREPRQKFRMLSLPYCGMVLEQKRRVQASLRFQLDTEKSFQHLLHLNCLQHRTMLPTNQRFSPGDLHVQETTSIIRCMNTPPQPPNQRGIVWTKRSLRISFLPRLHNSQSIGPINPLIERRTTH